MTLKPEETVLVRCAIAGVGTFNPPESEVDTVERIVRDVAAQYGITIEELARRVEPSLIPSLPVRGRCDNCGAACERCSR